MTQAQSEFELGHRSLPNSDGLAQLQNAFRRARADAGLTYAQIAERMGTTPSAVVRLEASIVSKRHSPTLDALRRYAAACGKTLRISIV
ncbi:XRE family transcriptional regulator [Caballeronia pedi]|uniref:XRE family transcriptional regulator n=1 Tax=Caballeronia pedi TaxID=1777141 RepID=A0A157Z1N0_9BURK|nr:helix-turn-helix transcriptional regulator [Caballeronia pedi]SAK39209.1 XRE family transcriptional regulator [Caballeronia pedi]